MRGCAPYFRSKRSLSESAMDSWLATGLGIVENTFHNILQMASA
jgi:hypothetical protein